MWVRPSGRTCGLKAAPTCSSTKTVPEEHATVSSNAVMEFSIFLSGSGSLSESESAFSFICFDPDSDSDPDPDKGRLGARFSVFGTAKFLLIFTKSSPILLS
jgi:hypothetical protein